MEDNRNHVIEELQKELNFYQQKIKDLDEIVVKKKLIDDAKKKINLYLAICGTIVLIVFGVFTYKEMNMIKSLEAQKEYLEKVLKIEEINLKSYVQNKVKDIEEANEKSSEEISSTLEEEYLGKIDEFSSNLMKDVELEKQVVFNQLKLKEKQLLELSDNELNKINESISKKVQMENDDFKVLLDQEKDQILSEIKKEINLLTDSIEPKINAELNTVIKSYDEYITKKLNSTEEFKNDISEGWVYFGELYSSEDKNNWKFRNFMINYTKSKYPANDNEVVAAKDMINIRESYFDWILLGGYNEAKIIGKLKKGTKLTVTDVHTSDNGVHVWVKIKKK